METKCEYSFKDLSEIFSDNKNESKLIKLLKSTWNDRETKNNVFRYKINNLKERTTDGGYLIQLNTDRGVKRRTPEHIDSIHQPFDPNRFNFTNISKDEVLFKIKKLDNDAEYPVIVNVSPISRWHSMLCPSLEECLPQLMTEESLQLTLEFMFLAQNRDLRVAFNSICAMASVNHLHYHLLFEKNNLPVENVTCIHIKEHLYSVKNYPASGFCFGVSNKNEIVSLTKEIYALIQYLTKKGIAHNVFITRGKSLSMENDTEILRVFIWPRKSTSGTKPTTSFNVAACEMSGWFPVYDASAYKGLKKSDIENEIKKLQLDDIDTLLEEVMQLH